MQRIAQLLVLTSAIGAALAARSAADEVRLTDGRRLVGKVVAKGEHLEITTRDGVVTVAADLVARHRTEQELRAELRRLEKAAGDSAAHQLELARAAFRFGLEAPMWRHLDRCATALERDDSALARRFRTFLADLEPEVLPAATREKSGRHRVRSMLLLAKRTSSPAKRQTIVELLVHEPDIDEVLRDRAHREPTPEQRSFALTALARRDDPGNAVALCKALVIDEERGVRELAARLIRTHGDTTDAVERLAPGFLHDHPSMRGRTAQAFGMLGDVEGAKYLVTAGPAAALQAAGGGGGIGVRAHMFQRTERAYIRDFEVEIAQAAAVANPIVGTAASGVVLDVRVAGVFGNHRAIVDAYREALKRIVGEDPGADPLRWQAWWDHHRPAPQEPTSQEPTTQRD